MEIPHTYSMFYFRAMQSFRLAQSFQDLLVPGPFSGRRRRPGMGQMSRPGAFCLQSYLGSNELFAEPVREDLDEQDDERGDDDRAGSPVGEHLSSMYMEPGLVRRRRLGVGREPRG